jgi:hypothetical protein
MADQIKGDVAVLSVYVGAAYLPVACLTSNDTSKSRNVIESMTKCNPGLTIKAAGSSSYEKSFEGEYIDTTSAGSTNLDKASYDALDALFDAGAEVTWREDTGLTDVPYNYGTCVITELSKSAPAGDEFITFTGTLSGSGAIVTVDPNLP